MTLIMNYFAIVLAVIVGSISVVHRTMVRKIYRADGRALSTFTLPKIIRQEYKQRFGVDTLYWLSRTLPMIFLGLALVGSYIAFRTP